MNEPFTVQPNKLSKKMKTDAHQITTQLAQEVPHTSSPLRAEANIARRVAPFRKNMALPLWSYLNGHAWVVMQVIQVYQTGII